MLALVLALVIMAGRARADEPETPTSTASAAAPATAEQPAHAPLSAEIDEWSAFAEQVVKMIAALGMFAAAGYLATKLLGKRLSPLSGAEDDLIRVLEQKRLDPKTTLYLVEVAGQATLVAVQDGVVKSLSSLSIDEQRLKDAIAIRDTRRRGRGEGKSFAKILSDTQEKRA